MSAALSGGTFVTFHIICCFALFLISSSTKTDKKKTHRKNWTAGVASKYKLEKSPRGGSSQLQINWNLLYCLWAILQLDQCIMSWHGPSLCADSSVTLGDPVKFISVVSPSQLAGFPPSAFPPSSRWFRSPVATREAEFITNSFCRFLIPHRGTCGSDKTLDTSNSSLGGLSPPTQVCDNDVSLFLCGSERGSVFLFF